MPYNIITGGSGGGGGSGLSYDSSVTNHSITTHPETYFHVPGDGNWADELGNLTQASSKAEVLVPGESTGSLTNFFGETNFYSGTGWLGTPGDFAAVPGTVANGFLGDFTLACLFRLAPGRSNHGSNGTFAAIRSASFVDEGLRLGLSTSSRLDSHHNGNQVREFSGTATNQGTIWRHSCVTVSGTANTNDWVQVFYIDGVEVNRGINLAFCPDSLATAFLQIGCFTTEDIEEPAMCVRSIIGIAKELTGPEVLALKVATVGA